MGKNLWGDFQIIATQEQGMVTFSNFDILKNNTFLFLIRLLKTKLSENKTA